MLWCEGNVTFSRFWQVQAAMSTGDFLRKNAETPLREHFVAAGAACELSTNCVAILEAARKTFVPIPKPVTRTDFRLRFWVDDALTSGPPWPKPYIRGLDHLVFAGFDAHNSLLMDLRLRQAIGRFSPAMGADQVYWKTVVLPVLMSVLGPSAGVTGVHCGCVAREGRGLLLAGRSGSGKSTLTFALARIGFSFLSDDWTYLSHSEGGLRAWGLTTRLKLLPDAIQLFPELQAFTPGTSVNGEQACEIDPELQLGFRRSRCCDPCVVVFLERRLSSGFVLTEMSASEAAERLEEDILAETTELLIPQLKLIQCLTSRRNLLLRYGGKPQVIADQVAKLTESQDTGYHLKPEIHNRANPEKTC